MKLATFTSDKFTRIGIVLDDVVIDLSQAVPDLPRDMGSFLAAGEQGMAKARAATERPSAVLPLQGVRLEAPIQNPRKFIAIGANYFLKRPLPGMSDESFAQLKAEQAHIRTTGHVLCANKQVTSINGPFDPVAIPKVSDQLICEA